MKNIYLSLIILLVIGSCAEEEIISDQPGISFYPTIAAYATEEDGKSYSIDLEVTKRLNQSGTVTVSVENGIFLITEPPIVGGSIQLEFAADQTNASISVMAGDDNFGTDYKAVFKISSVSGGISSVGVGEFTLFVADADQEAVFEDNFEANNLNKWKTHNTAGSNGWEIRDFSGNKYAVISNFNNTGDPTEDWLISPVVDFDNLSSETLTFQSQTAFNNGNVLKVVVISQYTGGTPSIVKTLSPKLDPHTGGGFGKFTSSGILDLSDITGKGHIAFYYKATDANDGSQWQIDDVVIKASNPNGGSGGNEQFFTLPFSDDLNTCGDFAVPANFIQEKTGAKTDRGWGCTSNGVSGSQSVRASALGGIAGSVDAWLISAKQFDLASASILSFDAKSPTAGLGSLKVLWSDSYTGSGDPTSATWTELTGFTLPAGGSNTFIPIEADLSGAIGKTIYIAFQYTGASNTDAVVYDIDNINVAAGTGGGGGGAGLIVDETFDNCNALNSFSQFSVIGDQVWDCTTFGKDGSTAVQISGFSGSALANEDWLISPSMTLSSASTLAFEARTKFAGLHIKVKISSDYSGTGDPTAATWTDLTVTLPAMDTDVWTNVGPVNLSTHAGANKYVAFVYYSNPTDGAPRWTLENVKVTE